MNALALVLALAAADVPPTVPPTGAPPADVPAVLPSDAPPADATPAPVEVSGPEAPRGAPVHLAPNDVDGQYTRTHAVLTAFAQEGLDARVSGAVTSGVLGAGLIGAGIAYVAVANLDHQLSQRDHEDTQLAGFVIGGAAVIPAALMVAQIALRSPEEERLAAFEADASTPDAKRARVQAARASMTEASGTSIAPVIGGAAFIAGGLVSAAAGGVFLALPHIPDVERGPMTHATGAELIGAGVAAVGIGTALFFTSGSSAPLQMKLLDAAGDCAAE